MEEMDLQSLDTIMLASRFNDIIKEVKETKKQLSNQQSILDQKVSDIQHYIESRNLNAVEGYKAYKLLQDTLRERRVVKSKIAEVDPIYSALITSKLDSRAATIKEKVAKINSDNKISGYNVRIIQDTFGRRIENSNSLKARF